MSSAIFSLKAHVDEFIHVGLEEGTREIGSGNITVFVGVNNRCDEDRL